MTVDFNDYFWGEKNTGFDVLYHNMKFGLVASKELSEFFREKSNIEEQNSKLMSKLAHKAGTGCTMVNSTFAPVWTVLKTSAEKLSTLHLQMVQKLSELVKDVAKYADELHKKHKTVKEEEAQTLECVKAVQASTIEVQKAREFYCNKVQELEKLRKEHASQKDIEKLELKLRKLQDDYKLLLEKHSPIKNEFERRMTHTCKRFQDIEEIHLRQMKEFLSTYLELLQNNHDMVGQVHSDFKRQFLDMTVDKLLEQFVLNKYTGLEKPEIPELDLVPLPLIHQLSAASETHLNHLRTSSAPSVPSINNSVSSINKICNNSLDQKIGQEDKSQINAIGGENRSGNGSGSTSSIVAVNNDTSLKMNSGKLDLSRPTSPQLNAVQTSTGNLTPSATSSTTVKSNFLHWLASSMPSKQQQSQQQQSQNMGISNSLTSGSGNFAVLLSNVNKNTTISISTTHGSTNTQITTFGSSGTFDKSLTHIHGTPLTNHLHHHHYHQQQQQHQHHHHHNYHQHHLNFSLSNNSNNTNQNPQSVSKTESSSMAPSATQRRTTSLLNIFSSNSQVSGILRSRRDKAKSKKLKKKKDAEFSDSKPEKHSLSDERTINSFDYENYNKSALPNSLDNGANLFDNTIAGKVGTLAELTVTNSAITSSSVLTTAVASAQFSDDSNGNGLTNVTLPGVNGCNGLEVDEDGYSIQPPKDIILEANSNKDVSGFYSDSDSDSDNDKPEQRIHVKIKPLKNGQAPMSASVDELRATVENMSLSPTGVHYSQQLQQSIVPRLVSRQQSPEISNASTPTATVHPYAPLQSPTFSTTNNSKYADLGDLFSEFSDLAPSVGCTANFGKNYGRQIPTPTSAAGSTIAIPRPPSRRSEIMIGANRSCISPTSLSNVSRADSVGSLEFRSGICGLGTSRGPSPLTIGVMDAIPIAVAFHEIIHAYFKGSDETKCQVKISGDMMLSFPAGIIGLLANKSNPAKLSFRIKNIRNLENFIPNNKLMQVDKYTTNALNTTLEFNMTALGALLRKQYEQNPSAAYFNVDILKYQVRVKSGASSCPFQLVSYWKCEPTYTALKIDYKYNNHAMANACPLLNVAISVPVNGSVKNIQSKPHSVWMGDTNRLLWNFVDISQKSQEDSVGTLRARLELKEGPSTPALITAQFNCEGTTLSGIEFELQGSGYRISLVKRRFVSGKYICEADGICNMAASTSPSVGSSSPFSAKSN